MNSTTIAFSPAGTAVANVVGADGFITVSLVTGSCIGDCDGSAVVTVDELLTMVNIALGDAQVSDCEAGDSSGDGQITVDEILTAVNNALDGCPGL